MDRDETKEDPFGDIYELDDETDEETIARQNAEKAAAMDKLDDLNELFLRVNMGDWTQADQDVVRDTFYERAESKSEQTVKRVAGMIRDRGNLLLARKAALKGNYGKTMGRIRELLSTWDRKIGRLLRKILNSERLTPEDEEDAIALKRWTHLLSNIVALARENVPQLPHQLRVRPPILTYQPSRGDDQPKDIVQQAISEQEMRAIVLSAVMVEVWIGGSISEDTVTILDSIIDRTRGREELAYMKQIMRVYDRVVSFESEPQLKG